MLIHLSRCLRGFLATGSFRVVGPASSDEGKAPGDGSHALAEKAKALSDALKSLGDKENTLTTQENTIAHGGTKDPLKSPLLDGSETSISVQRRCVSDKGVISRRNGHHQ